MDIAQAGWGAASRKSAFLLLLALLWAGCSEESVRPGINPQEKGYIEGVAYLDGAVGYPPVRIDISVAGTSQLVSSVVSGNAGYFESDALEAGIYDLTATTAIFGYYSPRIPNISVVPGRRTWQRVDVPDTSVVVFENLTPDDGQRLVGRRPLISGEFRCVGSGFRLDSFGLYLNGERVPPASVDVDDSTPPLEPGKYGRFSYMPSVNLSPGNYELRAIITKLGTGQPQGPEWGFTVLDGGPLPVPGQFATIADAVLAANDGDSVIVAPGTYDVRNVRVDKDLVFLGEGPGVTTLTGVPGYRLFDVEGVPGERSFTVLFENLTLTGGAADVGAYGGAVLVNDARLAIDHCAFTGNEAAGTGFGGALALYNTDAVIRDCVFTGNRAYRGGAIGSFDSSDLVIDHCLFIRNVNHDQGGAIYITRTQADILSSTFYRNDSGTGIGGAIMIDGFLEGPASMDTEGNLFIENQARSGSGIYFKDSILRSVCDGLYNNSGVGIAGTGGNYTQDRLLDLPPGVDPGFCDLADEDLRLHPESPFREDGCERGALPLGCGELP